MAYDPHAMSAHNMCFVVGMPVAFGLDFAATVYWTSCYSHTRMARRQHSEVIGLSMLQQIMQLMQHNEHAGGAMPASVYSEPMIHSRLSLASTVSSTP